MDFRCVFLVYIIADNGIQRQSQGQQERNDRQGNCDTFSFRMEPSFENAPEGISLRGIED